MGTAVQSVAVTIASQGRLYLPATVTLAPGGGAFAAYGGSMAFTYRARTTGTGVGTITVQSSGDFAPTGGPSVATGMLTYACGSDGYATPCAGTQTASPTAQRPVLNLGSSACIGGGSGCSASDPAAGTIVFDLTNDVTVPTGSYSVQLVFTISCT